MNRLDYKNGLFFNPYFDNKNESISEDEDEGHIIRVAYKAIAWAQNALFDDEEKRIEFTGRVITWIDWGVFSALVGIQAMVIVDSFFDLHLERHPEWAALIYTIKVLALPFAIFFFVMAVIEGFFEGIKLKQVIALRYRVNHLETPQQKMEWIRQKYFTLTFGDTSRIKQFIETTLPKLTHEEKGVHFDRIAQKAFTIRIDSLKRRLTPGLVDEIQSQMNSCIHDLKSTDPKTRAIATEKAENLFKSINRATLVKIIIHTIALLAIGLTLTSIVGVFASITLPYFFIGLVITSLSLYTIKFIISYMQNKGLLNPSPKVDNKALSVG